MMGIKLNPSINGLIPNVKRMAPLVVSVPIVDSTTPNVISKRVLMNDVSVNRAKTTSPTKTMEKYSMGTQILGQLSLSSGQNK